MLQAGQPRRLGPRRQSHRLAEIAKFECPSAARSGLEPDLFTGDHEFESHSGPHSGLERRIPNLSRMPSRPEGVRLTPRIAPSQAEPSLCRVIPIGGERVLASLV